MGKEFLNKMSYFLYNKLNIKGAPTAPAHPQCNAQAKIFNQTIGKYMKNVRDRSILNWEWYLVPLMFCYNTSYHAISQP